MKKLTYIFLIYSGLISILFAQQKQNNLQPDIDFTSNLPIIKINTNGQAIHNSYKIIVDMEIINNGDGYRNDYNDTSNDYNGKIAIEYRGSSSQMFPKKQFAVETRDSLDNDLDVSILGLPKDNDWILSAPYTDKSLMRDVLAFKIWSDMGYYASRWKFCELFLNEEYQGVYIVFEKVKRGKNRVSVSKLEPADSLASTITGGYIFKIDKWDGENNQAFQSFYSLPNSSNSVYYQYHYPKPEDINPLQETYIKTLVRAFESAMNSAYYADTAVGYAKYIDVNSFADNLILNEFVRNVDGYRLSSYFYKDRDDKDNKIYAGPVWDNNLSFGNADYNSAWYINGWQLEFLSTDRSFLSSDPFPPPFWWIKLFKEPKFISLVKTRYNEFRKNILSLNYLNSFIDSVALKLDEAQKRNYQKWPILNEYVWPNPWEMVSANTYAKQITYMKNWIKNRALWMDSQLITTDVHTDEKANPDHYCLEQNYPNPFNPTTTIKYSIPVETRHSAAGGSSLQFVTLMIYDILGNEVITLVNEEQPAGNYEVEFNGSHLPSGIYFYELRTGSFISTKKMLMIK
ncbi:MAG: T9SS C-terminal target domain-containing protein [Ignavibacteriales bacterium]|nr:MAG: T9SS C-terminal target domain-containing protein [Ignavibacteriales bacterium]